MNGTTATALPDGALTVESIQKAADMLNDMEFEFQKKALASFMTLKGCPPTDGWIMCVPVDMKFAARLPDFVKRSSIMKSGEAILINPVR